MRGYDGVTQSLSACVHFVRNDEIDLSIAELADELRRRLQLCAYVDYEQVAKSGGKLIDALGAALDLAHAPYGERRYIEFLDDLITLAQRYKGLLIVIDRADLLLKRDQNEMFDLIEAFLAQFHHWYEKQKACHLCFQMERNADVSAVFGQFDAAQVKSG